MWKRFCCLVLLAFFAAPATSTESCLDPKNIEDNVFLWESLFTKINTIVSETSRLSESQKALTTTLLELKERQEKQETQLSEFIKKSETAFSNLEKRQDNQETKLSQIIENNENHFTTLKNRHDNQDTKLSEYMKKSETAFSNLDIRELLHTVELTDFINTTQNDLMTMKNGFQQQQSKLSYFMDQYLDNNAEWTTVLRRQDGSVDFYRNWTEYQNGFGNTDGEFFIGLDKLHNLTTLGAPQELLIVLKDFKNEKRIARYNKFKIGNALENYQLLELGTYSGDAGDSLVNHKNLKFTTYDYDNDDSGDSNCAAVWKGAWWFHDCYYSHLFGQYRKKDGVAWNSWKGKGIGLKFAEMKIRSKFN